MRTTSGGIAAHRCWRLCTPWRAGGAWLCGLWRRRSPRPRVERLISQVSPFWRTDEVGGTSLGCRSVPMAQFFWYPTARRIGACATGLFCGGLLELRAALASRRDGASVLADRLSHECTRSIVIA